MLMDEERTGAMQEHDEKSHNSDEPAALVSDAEKLGGSEPESVPARTPAAPSQDRGAIPRSERRGFLGQLTIIPEVENPKHCGNATRWFMTVIVTFAAATSSIGTSISYPALASMAADLGTTTTIINFSLAFYMLAMAITPMWWSYFSETLGRRSIYLLSFFLFVIFSCISAISSNAAMFIVFRTLSGGAAAAVQAVGAGTIADLWEPEMRGRAMGVFYLGPLCGPGLAPIIGGVLTEALGWRSTIWFLAIFGATLVLLIMFCLPETVARKSVDPRRTGLKNVVEGFVRPIMVLKLLRYPPIVIAVYSSTIAFGSMYVINISIQSDFLNAPYNFTTTQVGLLYIAPMIGYAISSLLGGRWIDYIMKREARKAGRYDADGELVYLPEDRMKENIWLSSTLYPAAIIWYGWTVEKGLPWYVSSIANVFFGLGCMLVFGAVTTMLTEFTPKRSSSGVAINNFSRSTIACIGAIVTQPLIDALGTGWTCTIIGLFAWVTGNAAIWALKTWAPKWRITMDKKLNAQGSAPKK